MIEILAQMKMLIGNATYFLGAQNSSDYNMYTYNSWDDGTPFDYGNFTQSMDRPATSNCLTDAPVREVSSYQCIPYGDIIQWFHKE